MNITFEMDDVMNVIRNIKGYLIVLAIILILAVVLTIAVKKLSKGTRSFVRKQTWLAALLAVVVVVNLICVGPMRALINAAMAETKTLPQEIAAESRVVIEEIANEGIVLAKNEGLLPLAAKNLNVFGWTSVNPLYGGSGSGSIDTENAVSLLGGLESAGFVVNQELADFYTAYETNGRGRVGSPAQEWTLPEPAAAGYSDSMIQNAREFSDTALFVIGRSGGEGADLPFDMGSVIDGSWNTGIYYKNASFVNNTTEYDEFQKGQSYLELSRTEKDLLELVCSNFDQVVVVYNGSNTFELGWTEEYEEIKSVLLVPGVGVTGFHALGGILAGTVNPSGKTTDTWVHDLTKIPAYNNYGEFAFDSRLELVEYLTKRNGEARIQGVGSFVNYVEGIYAGYRFYETAAAEGLIQYDQLVQYPFGYGLSYTSFEQTLDGVRSDSQSLYVDVTVKNTGSVAGKEVVQIYYDPPYINGGIEKSSSNLAAFEKTQLLAPGETQTLTLSLALEDMASFDAGGRGCYVLEQGDYIISLNSDSHNRIAQYTYTQEQDVVYDASNSRGSDEVTADSKLSFAQGDVIYLSRADGFANYREAIAGPPKEQYHMTLEELIPYFVYDETQYNNPDDIMPVMGAKNHIKLSRLRGLAYDDPMWESLLDEMTFEDMVNLIQFGGYQTISLNSIGKLATIDVDGASGLNDFVSGSYGTGFGTALLLAQTWNTELARLMGDAMGKEADGMGISGWYAPSMNMHRTPFGGRNFEYYSEDGYLSGKMAASVVSGARSLGLYSYIKHFVLNDQEINRHSIFTWADEQTIREIYLKPFEITVKENKEGPLAVMSSYNYLGTEWAGSCAPLLNGILREEWGFRGMVLTDYFNQFYMDADKAVRGGNDLMLSSTGGQHAVITDKSATSVIAMRQASKNIMFTVVNSNAYADYNENTIASWIKILIAIDVLLGGLFVGLEILAIKKIRKSETMVIEEQINPAEEDD